MKLVAQTGEVEQEQEAAMLNRVARCVSRDAEWRMAMELAPDQRHVEVLLTELGLADAQVKKAARPGRMLG